MCFVETKRVNRVDRSWNEPARPVSYYTERPDGYETRVATVPAAFFRGRRSSSSLVRERDGYGERERERDWDGRRRSGRRGKIW
jgi:hypothetical protein